MDITTLFDALMIPALNQSSTNIFSDCQHIFKNLLNNLTDSAIGVLHVTSLTDAQNTTFGLPHVFLEKAQTLKLNQNAKDLHRTTNSCKYLHTVGPV